MAQQRGPFLLSNSSEVRPALSLSTDFQIQRKQIWETFIRRFVCRCICLEPPTFQAIVTKGRGTWNVAKGESLRDVRKENRHEASK
jgi:hypothetical protein